MSGNYAVVTSCLLRNVRKVRRGKVGGFADYFTGDDLSFADQLMARYDYNQALQKVGAVSFI